MPFITPALFWAGAAAATGPIIIHLLNRRRFRTLDWAAMEFLLQSQRKNRRRVRIEELILLLLRVLAILLMGAALARPLLSRAGLLDVLGKSGTDVVVILDDSFSMAQKHGAEDVFSKARDGLLQVAQITGKEDTFSVFLTSRADPFFPPGYLTDFDAFKNEVKGLKPSDFGTDLVASVQRAVKVFDESRNPEKRLYILSDFRRREWSLDANTSQGKKIAALLSSLDRKRFKVSLVDFGAEDFANLAVTELVCTDKHVAQNVRLQFRASVVNWGPQPVDNVPVALQIGDLKLPSRIVDRIEPGQTKSVDFSYRFKEAGAVALSATVPGDQLAPDNGAYLALRVTEAVPVLLINGNPDAQPFVNETDYFVAALDPGKKNLSGFRPDVVLDRDLPNVKLSQYDCVVLANVSSLLPDSVKALEEYVRGGGGLIMFLGDKVDREFYNGQLYKEGRGLLPLAIDRPPQGDLEKRQKFAKLKNEAANHPILSVFAGTGEQLLDLVPFYQYFPLRADRLAAVSVLASFVGADLREPLPAMVEKTYGKGRVIQIASSMNAAWNDWPKSISYPIVVNEMVAYLARTPRHENTQPVGEPLKREVEPEFFDAVITLKMPPSVEPESVRIAPQLAGEQMFVTWPPLAVEGEPRARPTRIDRTMPGLDRAGIYTLELTAPAKTARDYFARNVNADEGRLEKADSAVVRQIMKDLPFEYRQGVGSSEIASASAGQELWRAVLYVLLAVLVIETILAQRFGHYSS